MRVEADADATPEITAVHATIDPDPGAASTFIVVENLIVVDILQMTAPTKTTGAIFSAIVRVDSIGTDSAADGDIIITLVDTLAYTPEDAQAKITLDTKPPLLDKNDLVVASGPVTGITADFTIIAEFGEVVSADSVKSYIYG